ncbi:MAG: prepilin-type N-terminal cleavage/methylation domain-containing protein [Lactobacillales bacterium]|nr:prepilin-type N-terminal cleavage/methylation domain-containing protein [Lactobacillales bacterium]
MKNKKGFTLIELLAVIVILAIIALIATPIILNMINDARKSAAVDSAYGYIEAIEYQNSMSKLNNEKYKAITSKDVSTINGLVNLKGTKPTSGNVEIDESGRVIEATLVINGYTVEYENGKATVKEKKEEEPEIPITYDEYKIGDDVTLKDGTTWIVVKDSTANESKIKIISTSNIHPNLTTETGTAMFLNNDYGIAYDIENSNVWETSTLKEYLDTTVKTRLEASLGTTLSDITILGAEEFKELGCSFTGDETSGYYGADCNTIKEEAWYSKIFLNFNSWINLPHVTVDMTFGLNTAGLFSVTGVIISGFNGARPVITVDKSIIS